MSTNKPSQNEEEYFAHEEAEKKRQIALSKAQAVAVEERARLKALHHMRCPKCGMELHVISMRGVMVDRCFHCHGVFLDASELNKLAGEEGYWARTLRFFAQENYGE